MLPSFLSPLSPEPLHHLADAQNAVFQHRPPLGQAHCLWWSPKDSSAPPEVIVLFIPGNPGLVQFYTPFLSVLYGKDTTSRVAILAHAHLNHTPLPGPRAQAADHSLTTQTQSALEVYDAIKLEFGSSTKVFLIGHSVGAFLSTQVLKARRETVTGVFLLFPTISNIGNTPNGRKLSPIFGPFPRRIISSLGYAARFIPLTILSYLFREWPMSQLLVLQDLIRSPLSIEAALCMANDEMNIIKDLDLSLLRDCKDKLCFYYAEKDDWVGEEKDRVLKSLHPDQEVVSIVHDKHDIPHAFCINHGDRLAEQCFTWLEHFRK